jgi:hypothetical protein
MADSKATTGLPKAQIPSTCDKSRNKVYDKVERADVTKVKWNETYPDYKPVYYVSGTVLYDMATGHKPSWADMEDVFVKTTLPRPDWNKVDTTDELRDKAAPSGKREFIVIDRRSFMGTYKLDGNHDVPLNPTGRTGICGRGVLNRWGPNHAVDCIITRYTHAIICALCS